MTRKLILILAGVFIAFTVAYLLRPDGETPGGQPAIVALNHGNLEVLQKGFNGAPRSIRLITLLSPT